MQYIALEIKCKYDRRLILFSKKDSPTTAKIIEQLKRKYSHGTIGKKEYENCFFKFYIEVST